MKNKIKFYGMIIGVMAVIVLILFLIFGGANFQRSIIDFKSNYGGGLEREINIYTANGDLIAHYEGKIDIESDNTYIKFDIDGKRYIYYNCFIETIAKY